jgi:hypothetical protein
MLHSASMVKRLSRVDSSKNKRITVIGTKDTYKVCRSHVIRGACCYGTLGLCCLHNDTVASHFSQIVEIVF